MLSAREPTLRQTLTRRTSWLLVVTGFAFIVPPRGFLVAMGILCLFTAAIILVRAVERFRPAANAANHPLPATHRQELRAPQRRAA